MEKSGDSVRDLAEVRKLIEGMNALVNSHQQLQQQKGSDSGIPKSAPNQGKSLSYENVDSSLQADSNANRSGLQTDNANGAKNVAPENTVSMAPANAVVIEVEHTILSRTLYFSLMRNGSYDRAHDKLAKALIWRFIHIWHGPSIQRHGWALEMPTKSRRLIKADITSNVKRWCHFENASTASSRSAEFWLLGQTAT
ncbi:hypothetical protein NQZ79_g618 [Umbelopsis isabellina]|nr:hypothetical protein NQZ79_g618 [Umbelopsis isabellina]